MIAKPHHFEFNFEKRQRDAEDMAKINGTSVEKEVARTPIESAGYTPWFPEPAPDRCFFCGEMLTLPAIMWHGAGGDLWLHPKCAESLKRGLMRDVLEVVHGRDFAQAWLREEKAKGSKLTDQQGE